MRRAARASGARQGPEARSRPSVGSPLASETVVLNPFADLGQMIGKHVRLERREKPDLKRKPEREQTQKQKREGRQVESPDPRQRAVFASQDEEGQNSGAAD